MEDLQKRPLSEVELQTLDIHELPSSYSEKIHFFDKTSKLDNGLNDLPLAPPSLRELGLFCRTSLESLHLEHAYSSINSENAKARKERKKSFEVLQKRKISNDSSKDNVQIEMITESEKSRKERKRSFNKQRSRSTTTKPHSQEQFELLIAECENAYNSLFIDTSIKRKERKKGIVMRDNSREDFNVLIGENYKNLQKSKSIPEPHVRRFSTGTQYKRYPSYKNGEVPTNGHELDHHRRSSSIGSAGSYKKNDIHVILDESETNGHEDDIETPQRRYSTGMKPRFQGLPDLTLPENRYPYKSIYTTNGINDNKSIEIPISKMFQEEKS